MNVHRGHIRDAGLACWCHPRYETTCVECAATGFPPDCWRCGGTGMVEVPPFETEDVTPLLVIHNTDSEPA